MSSSSVPSATVDAVMKKSDSLPEDTPVVRGYDFNVHISSGSPVDYAKLLESMINTGFQATHYGQAMEIVQKMLKWRLSHEPIPVSADEGEEASSPDIDRSAVRCTIYLGYTSNLVSSGLRDIIRVLCEHKMIDAIVTTAGGIEEDFIKCLHPTYVGDFKLKGSDLRAKGLNRIGNLLIPNNNYCLFEDWVKPIFAAMLKEQKEQKTLWTPSRIINRLGKEIDNPESIYYWCSKNNIPVYCPAITDGSLGDMMFFQSFNQPGFIIDILEDLRQINQSAIAAEKTGAIILGGGVIKHHICNANLMRNGADFMVYVNTAHEFDGSDAGASPDEAVSWGKIKADAKAIKICADATLVFPLMVAQAFIPEIARRKEEEKLRSQKKEPVEEEHKTVSAST